MLSSIRNKTKGWVAYTIIGLIIVPFALFGIAEYSTGVANVVVAIIDGDEISQEQFLSKFNRQKRRLQQELGEKYTAEFDNRLKRLTIQQIIAQNLLARLADESGYVTTTDELQASIQSNNNFKVEGKFSLDLYKRLLRLNGYSNIEYERAQLAELTQQQIKQNLLDSAFVGASVLKQLQSLNKQQREFDYIRLNTADYTDKVSVDAKRIEDFYNKQKTSFFEPEQVKLDFVELSLKKIAKNIQVNDDQLLDFYQQEKDRFSTEEERQAQHILFKSEATANKVLEKLKQGGDFAKLASKYSDDSASKDSAGDLGFFGRGVMVPAFEAQVFAMQIDELSGLVKSEFGYHIIKLNKIKLSTLKSFAEVEAELLDLYTQQQAKKQLYNLTEQLANLAYETSLEELASQMDLELQSTEFFNTDNTKLSKKIVNAAFSDVVLNKGENSEVLELSADKFAVVRLQQKIPQRQKTFDEVRAQIKTDLTAISAKEFINKITQNIANLLKNGDNKEAGKIIDKYKLKWQKVGWVERTSDKATTAIIQQVFTLPKPSVTGTTYGAANINDNYSVAVRLAAVKAPQTKVADRALEGLLLQFESDEIFQTILTTLRQNSDIEIFAERL